MRCIAFYSSFKYFFVSLLFWTKLKREKERYFWCWKTRPPLPIPLSPDILIPPRYFYHIIRATIAFPYKPRRNRISMYEILAVSVIFRTGNVDRTVFRTVENTWNCNRVSLSLSFSHSLSSIFTRVTRLHVRWRTKSPGRGHFSLSLPPPPPSYCNLRRR